MKYEATRAHSGYACGDQARTHRTNKRGMRLCVRIFLALAFHLSSTFDFLPSSAIRQLRGSPFPPCTLIPSFFTRFFLSRNTYAYTHARIHAWHIYTCNMCIVYERTSSSSSSSSLSSSSSSSSSLSSSLSSFAPLGRAHESKGKERGHDIFQDGIFNALVRSVTPGKSGPRDWPASPRIPGPSLAEQGPRPTPMPSVLLYTRTACYVPADAAPSSSRADPSWAEPWHAMPLVRVPCVSAYACSVGHAIRHSIVRRAEVAARCNEEPSLREAY